MKTNIYQSQKYNYICSRYISIKDNKYRKTVFNGNSGDVRVEFQEGTKLEIKWLNKKINPTRSLLDEFKWKQLQWYTYVQYMDEGKIIKEKYKMATQR